MYAKTKVVYNLDPAYLLTLTSHSSFYFAGSFCWKMIRAPPPDDLPSKD